VAHSFCTAIKWLSESKKRRQDCLMLSTHSFYSLCLRSVAHSLTCCFPGMCHSSTRPGTSLHVTKFYQIFPRISTASDKCSGEKAWVRGYTQSTIVWFTLCRVLCLPYLCHIFLYSCLTYHISVISFSTAASPWLEVHTAFWAFPGWGVLDSLWVRKLLIA